MKKNILSIIILALCLVNLVMTSLLIFTFVPASKKTDNLISQVASVIELELTGYDEGAYKIEDLDPKKIAEPMQRNLQPGTDGKPHYATMEYVTVSLNKNSESYSELSKMFAAEAEEGSAGVNSKIIDIVGTALAGYTVEEARDAYSSGELKDEVLKELRKYFGSSDFIVDVSFGGLVFA